MNVPTVTVVSDDPVSRYYLRQFCESEKFHAVECTFQECFSAPPPDRMDTKLFLVDVTNSLLPENSLYEKLKTHFSAFPIIIIDPAPRTSERVLRYLRWGYVTKPCLPEDLKRLLLFVLRMKQYVYAYDVLRQLPSIPVTTMKVFGESDEIRHLISRIEEIAPSHEPVLLTGELGTRKEIVAQHIHSLSMCRNFSGASILDAFGGSMESFCFGAAPGAIAETPYGRIAMIELVHQGTFYIDHIQLSYPSFQKRLLACIKHQTLFRIGSNRPIPVNVRFIISTYSDLETASKKGQFLPELYEILSKNIIHVPPLRECKKDISLFFTQSLNWQAKINHQPEPRIEQSAYDKLNAHLWPYNTRELEVVVRNALVLDTDGVITADDIVFSYADVQPSLGSDEVFGQTGKKTYGLAGMNMDEIQKQAVMETLEFCRGNKNKTAKTLGISEKTLYSKLRQYGLG